MGVEIKKCVFSAASKCFHGVQRLLKSYLLSRTTELFMYKVLIRPVVIHATETLVIAPEDEEALCSFERILTCILEQYKRTVYAEEDICKSFQKFCVWWQHCALLHMTEIISCVWH
jgi:hypothetical protein